MALTIDKETLQFDLSPSALDMAVERCNILIALCHDNNVSPDEALLAVAIFIGRALRDKEPEQFRNVIAALNNLSYRSQLFHRGEAAWPNQ